MKIYCYYTTSYEVLAKDWLKASVQDDCELILKKGPDHGASVNYKERGWHDITRSKVGFIIEAIKENWNQVFIFSDPDVQFLGRVEAQVLGLVKNRDLVVQRDHPNGTICSGFFVLRSNDKTLNLWQDISKDIGGVRGDDQDCLNRFLNPHRALRFISKNGWNRYQIKWEYLPKEFLSGGTLSGKHWVPGLPMEIPEDIVIHHANWTVGLQNKIAQLEYVRDLAAKRQK